MSRLSLVETSLRCGQQMLLVSRLRRRHAVPVAALLDSCRFAAIDAFGGATFEASLRFLGEHPFDTLRALCEAAPLTPKLALLRGQALVGHRQVADDLVDAFVAAAAEAGVDVFRCYDSLNDVRNLERCVTAVHAAGRLAEGCIVYAESPVDGVEHFVALGRRLADLGYDSLCVYDPVGLLGAGTAEELVRGLVEATGLEVAVHCAALAGQAGLAYHAAALAGAARLDVALTPLAGGSSTLATEGVLHAFRGTDLEPAISVDGVDEASQRLAEELTIYHDIADPGAGRLDAAVLRDHIHPVAFQHAVAALRERDMLDRLPEVETELQRVRAELGHPPLVTPIGEIVATQAVYNVCDGDRYATISQEVKDFCLGLYGSPPGRIDPDVRRTVNGREEPITCRPADLLEPALPGVRREMEREGLSVESLEDVVTYALFPADLAALRRGEVQPELLGDEPAAVPVASEPADGAGADLAAPVDATAPTPAEPVAVPDEVREVTVEVEGEAFRVRVSGPPGTFGGGGGAGGGGGGGTSANGVPAIGGKPVVREGTVVAPMQGLILKVNVTVGQSVQIGDVVAVLEAMKMQNDITATRAGTITEVHVKEGTVVAPRAALVHIG